MIVADVLTIFFDHVTHKIGNQSATVGLSKDSVGTRLNKIIMSFSPEQYTTITVYSRYWSILRCQFTKAGDNKEK